MPLIKKMEPGLWEVRSHVTQGIARIIFTVSDGTMVLLHAFVKKTQKTTRHFTYRAVAGVSMGGFGSSVNF